jgi:nitrogen regulatory protein PII
MKMVSCIIRPEKLDAVTQALDKQHVVGMTLTDVRGFGRQKGHVEHYRGGEYTIRFIPKVKVDIVVQDEDVSKVMSAIESTARTGKVGDGKIFVIEVPNAMRIRTGEKGTSAL